MSKPVFLIDSLAGASSGTTVSVAGAEARHAVQARRIRVGELVEVADGAGGRGAGSVTFAGKDSETGLPVLRVALADLTMEPAPAPILTLVQALAKGGRDEMAVEVTTEIGVDEVWAWQSERSVSQWRGDKIAKGLARWAGIAAAAAKQSRRAFVPAVSGYLVGRELTEQIRRWVAEGSLILVLHESATAPLHEMAIDLGHPRVVVIVGPEGGLSEAETEAFTAAGAQTVRLGPHVLRTSTAGAVAVSLLAARLRWSPRE